MPPSSSTWLQPAMAALLALAAAQTEAAGFALIEQNVSGLGNAYAGAAASAEDASTVFFNPAGLMYLQGNQFVMGGHIVKPSAEFSGGATDPLGNAIAGGNGGDAGGAALVPNLYYSRRLPNDFVFGLGLNTPFGLKTEYDADWVGRYHSIESDVKTVNINPAVAYRAGSNLSVGVGVSAQYIEATLTQAIDPLIGCVGAVRSQNPLLDVATAIGACGLQGIDANTPDAVGTVEGDDWSFGFNFGLIYDLAPGSRIGFAYRSSIKQELEGDAAFSSVPPFFSGNDLLVPTDVVADVTLPESAALSLYHDINRQWAVLADATWTRWSRFEELRVDYASAQPDSVTTENWTDSMRYSLGMNYRHNSTWLLRAGVAFDEEPIRNAQYRTPRIPGNDRTWLAFGMNYRLSSDVSFDVGYAHLFVDDTPINHTDSNGFTITGAYDNGVDILSAQLNWTLQ